MLGKIRRRKWFISIGWTRRIEPHVENVLNKIKDLFDALLASEKHSYSLKIIAELEDLIQKKMEEHSGLLNKLGTIRISKEGEENKLWSILTFGSDAQIKVKSDRRDIEAFYKNYLESGLGDLGADLRKRLVDWRKIPDEEILREIESPLKGRIARSGFNDMTIIDAMKDEMEELGNRVQDCITNKSSPFIRHTARDPHDDRFLISGLDSYDIKRLPAIPGDVTPISSDLENKKRRMLFIRLSSNFSISDLAPYDFADKYSKAYEESLNKNHKWIHIRPEALGFEDPLGLSIGMEEESLIRTCQDVGIVFQQRGYYFEYEENGKRVVIAQGLENAIRRLQDDPKCANLLKEKLLEFLNNQTKEWIVDYLNDHDRGIFPDEAKFKQNHENKYKNAVSSYSYPISPHKIPSYILREIKTRIGKK